MSINEFNSFKARALNNEKFDREAVEILMREAVNSRSFMARRAREVLYAIGIRVVE